MDMITEFDKNILKKWALNYFPQKQRENSYMSVEDIWYMWENDTADIDNARFTNGVSRGVFIFDDSDYVVKFSLTEDYTSFISEQELYKEAKMCGVEKFFAPITYLCTIGGFKFYTQKKVKSGTRMDTDGESLSEASISLLNGCNDTSFCQNDLFDDFYENYEEEELYKLIDFINDYDINDIHYKNVGFLNNLPVIIDYAGY